VENRTTSYLGGNGFDIVDSIRLGNLTINTGIREEDYDFFAASTTSSTTGMPVSAFAPHISPAGGTDAHLTALRLDPAVGSTFIPEAEVFGTFLPGGPGDEREVRVAPARRQFLSPAGSPIPKDRLFFSYNTFSNAIPTDENAAMPDYPGGTQSYLLTVLESDIETRRLAFVDTTYGGGSQFDQVAGMAVDPNGAPAVVGLTFSQLNTSRGAVHSNRNGAFSGFFIRYSNDLSRIDYSTYAWGSQNSNATAINFDGFGQPHILGILGPGEQMTANAFQENHQGGPWDVGIRVITQPFLFNNGIGNGASFRPGASPQQISVAVGGRIGPSTPALLDVDAEGNLLLNLGGASVIVDGEPSPMTFASEIQNNFIYRSATGFRFEPAKGEEPAVATVQVDFGELSNIVEVPVMEANPGLFAADGSGQGQGVILNPDFTVNSAANPAPGDSFIVVFGTGGGITDPICPDGAFGPGVEPLPRLQLPVQVLVEGDEAGFNYAGSAPGLVCGVNQFNVIPTNNPSGPAVPIQVCVNEVCSNVVTAAFE